MISDDKKYLDMAQCHPQGQHAVGMAFTPLVYGSGKLKLRKREEGLIRPILILQLFPRLGLQHLYCRCKDNKTRRQNSSSTNIIEYHRVS